MSSSSTTDIASASQNQTQRTKTGCQNCRLRHLKCDDRRPSCVRCEKAGIDCVRGYNIRFRHGANPSVANVKGTPSAKGDYDFSKDQKWVKTARTLTFLDETHELINIYDHDTEDENSQPAPFDWGRIVPSQSTDTLTKAPATLADTQSYTNDLPSDGIPQGSTISNLSPGNNAQYSAPSEQAQSPWPPIDNVLSPRGIERCPRPSDSPASPAFSDRPQSADNNEVYSFVKRRRLTFESSYHGSVHSESPQTLVRSPADSWHTGWTPSNTVDQIASNSEIDLSFGGLENTVSQGLSRIYLDSPVWPLQDKEQARLLRYYVEHLSRNFDLTDPRKHFRSVVPQRAAICPTLMNAIFALSARHLSRIGDYDPLVSNKYHQECLKHLIPMLDDTDAILDENLLASTIILRHLEEFELPISGQLPADQHSHLLGAQAFIAAQKRAAVTGGLRQAAFWVGVRQEVFVAFVNQRPVLPALEHCNVDRSFKAAEDHIWACRMVVLCADVLRFCFGASPQTSSTYQYLADQVSTWYSSKPPSFTPVYYQPIQEGSFFPDIWFVGDEYATGLQHFHLSRILLASHKPDIPKLGPGRSAALKAMDDEIRTHVRILCGMCRSNMSTAPAYTYASMAVTMAGDKFTVREEQEELIEVLLECDRTHAWPTGTAVENLKSAWGWEV